MGHAHSRRRVVACAVLLIGGLLLAGCSAVSAVGSLQDAGFSQVEVSQGSGGAVRVSLGGVGTDQRQAAIVKAERVIWTKYPGTLRSLTVEADTASHVSSGSGTRHRQVTDVGEALKRTSTRAELAQRYGPRDPKLDTADPGPSAGTLWLIFGGIALVVIAVVVLLFVLIVRGRQAARRRRELFGTDSPSNPGSPPGGPGGQAAGSDWPPAGPGGSPAGSGWPPAGPDGPPPGSDGPPPGPSSGPGW